MDVPGAMSSDTRVGIAQKEVVGAVVYYFIQLRAVGIDKPCVWSMRLRNKWAKGLWKAKPAGGEINDGCLEHGEVGWSRTLD